MDDWRLNWGYRWLARVPTPLPWTLASVVGTEPSKRQRHTQAWLAERFAIVFPTADPAQCARWAHAHIAMLSQEMLDAMAFRRLGVAGGPRVIVEGLEHVLGVRSQGRGFILVLNHFDRLLTAPIALARRGVVTSVLTMPVLDNPELDVAHRQFLMRKIANYTAVTGGKWLSTDKGLRPVVQGLRAGEGWVVLADAWNPAFGRMRQHSFLSGMLQLPTGVERMATTSGAALLYAATFTERPGCLRVRVSRLPEDPVLAVDAVVRRLETDVSARPWAWWHWGLWDQMWRPSKAALAAQGGSVDDCR